MTEFNARSENRSYEESVTGYQNYVNEMERMLSGQIDLQSAHASSPTNIGLRRANSQSVASDLGKATKPLVPRRSLGGRATPNNARKVSGKRGAIELVEQKVMEDGPQRTISLWRERVAQSSVEDEEMRDEVNYGSHLNGSPTHRKVSSGDSRNRRVVDNGESVHAMDHMDEMVGPAQNNPKDMAYERSEVSHIMIMGTAVAS